MPKGIYKHKPHSEECKRKISEALKGDKNPNYGKSLSEETKKKISRANKGNIAWNKGIPITEEQKIKMSGINRGNKYHLGFHHSEEVKRKIREARKGQIIWNKGKKCPQTTGNKNGNWKGGITPESARIRNSIEFHLWREAVFARDNWTCQKCGEKGGSLRAHHINNFSDFHELRLAIDNGITLCKNCHKGFHSMFGKKDNTKEQLTSFVLS